MTIMLCLLSAAIGGVLGTLATYWLLDTERTRRKARETELGQQVGQLWAILAWIREDNMKHGQVFAWQD